MPNIPRGKIIGRLLVRALADEADHFMLCPACEGYFDKRDLAQVLEHDGPLPHPSQDKPQ